MVGIGVGGLLDEMKSGCILGGKDFLEKIQPALEDKSLLKEIPRCQRMVSRPSLDELLSGHDTLGKKERNERLKKAHLEYGYSFSEIGRHIGLHYATVSRITRGEPS